MNQAVFLDRDGVINPMVLDPATGTWDSPYAIEDFRLFPWVPEALRRLRAGGYLLFLVSNQPGYAKGQASLEAIEAIQQKLKVVLDENGITFAEFYYCYHHPEGVVPEYSHACPCRKPSPYFLKQAAQKHLLDMGASWMVGDQERDIRCGHGAGARTILVRATHKAVDPATALPDFVAEDLGEAVDLILKTP